MKKSKLDLQTNNIEVTPLPRQRLCVLKRIESLKIGKTRLKKTLARKLEMKMM